MKAEILKLAGVKNEKEFYKKFPTEQSFKAKYGKQLAKLEKAKMGDYISSPTYQEFNPMSYSDAVDNTESLMTGISTKERNRQQQLEATAAGKSSGGGFMDIVSQNLPQIAQAATMLAGAKNGKKLKKADPGASVMGKPFQGMPSKPTSFSVSSDSGFNTDVASNPYMSGSLIGGQKAQASSGSWAANPYIKSPFKATQATPDSKGIDWKGFGKEALPALANQAGSLIGAFEQIGAEKKKIKELNQAGQVSGVVAQAANSRPEQVQRRYVRPEDSLVKNVSPLGTGTNYLAAENGAEIANTYAPDVMYTDLGYEPLNDSNVKQYKKGGKLRKAEGGMDFGMFSGMGGSLGGLAASALQGGDSAGPGSQIGSTIGGIAGNLIPIPGLGPLIGSTIGGFLGGIIGGDGERQKQMKEAQKRIEENTLMTTANTFANNIQKQNSAFMEDGGWVSNDWQPQVIASFGDHSMKDLLAPDPMMDTLRAGGHLKYYTPPSAEAMYTGKAEYGTQMAMGGDLEVHRGYAEPISTNPYLPNNGETVMFRGPSHDDGGMPISYGENGVEVEGGEPAMVMRDGGKQDNLVVFGNMKIPDYGANEIGDKKAKGMKFKRYIADLSKQEAKNNKRMDTSIDLINDANVNNPFEQLAFNSGQAMLRGTQMQLKDIADKKLNTAAVQNAILDTADMYGLDSAKLSEKNIAGFGGKFTSAPIAKNGTGLTKKGKALLKQPASKSSNLKFLPNTAKIRNEVDANLALDPDTGKPYVAPEVGAATMFKQQLLPDLYAGPANAKYTPPTKAAQEAGTDWTGLIQAGLTSAAPFLRPRLSNALDPSQIYPEMMAMSMNQLEPVQAQLYSPIVTGQPTSFSLQDQLNEVTAQSRAAEKMAAYNPEAAAMIFSQASQAKNKILGEQFRMNQAEKQRVAEQNASILNDAQLKNLSILDQQYARQTEAKSKTKAQSIEIAKSIADKIAQNKLENKQLRTMENLYPAYSFTSEGTAYKNPLYQAIFNPLGGGKTTSGKGELAPGYAFTYDENKNIIGTRKTKEEKNGGIVKAMKNL